MTVVNGDGHGEEGEGVVPAAQRARRQRVLDATLALATQGGYEAVQMRAVADRADVALGTLYRYFPSKIHLLVSAMGQVIDQMSERVAQQPPGGATRYERTLNLLMTLTRALQRAHDPSAAMVRALMFADASVAPEVEYVRVRTSDLITGAMNGPGGSPSEEDEAIARVLQSVWLASLITWLSGRSSIAQVDNDLKLTARLLLD